MEYNYIINYSFKKHIHKESRHEELVYFSKKLTILSASEVIDKAPRHVCRASPREFLKESQQKDEKLEHLHIFPILPKAQMKILYIKLFLNFIHEI